MIILKMDLDSDNSEVEILNVIAAETELKQKQL